LLQDVSTWPRKPINWSEKARQYHIQGLNSNKSPSNAGQLLKDYLQSRGVDVSEFVKEAEGKKLKIKLNKKSKTN
jgi:hypothetical protein